MSGQGAGTTSRPGPPGRAVTRQDVARVAGVSTAVVSYVINGGPRPVADATRQRVLEAIATLNYRPNSSARALRLGRTHTLALLVPAITNPFFAELAGELQRASRSAGFALQFADVGAGTDRADEQISALVERQVDGIMIIGLDAETDLSPALERGIPVVALDRFAHKADIPTVAIDDRSAAADGVRHLAQHGHQRIAMLAGPRDAPASDARVLGWSDALDAAPSDLRGLLFHEDFSHAGGQRAAREILDRGTDATALFVASDIQAVGLLHELNRRGVEVPEDLALMGFDGTPEGVYSWPSLSTVRQPVDTMADVALAMVTGTRPSAHHVVQHTVVARSSCGCVPKRDD